MPNFPQRHRVARRPTRLRRLLALAVASAVLAGACLTPTQITVQITTNAVCLESTENELHLHDVGIIAGSPDAVMNGDHAPNAVTSDCGPPKGTVHKGYGPQEVGTMVIVPSGDKDVPARIVVVGRVAPLGQLQPNRSLESCIQWAFTPAPGPIDAKDPDFEACIVSRRNLAFFQETKLELPIQLDTSCAGIVCDADSYCFDSHCVSASVNCDERLRLCDGNNGGAGGAMASSSGSMASGSMSSSMSSGSMSSGSMSSGSVTGSSSDVSSSSGMGGMSNTSSSTGLSSSSSSSSTSTASSSSTGMMGTGGASSSSSSSSSGGGQGAGGSGAATTVSVSTSAGGMGGAGAGTCFPPCAPGCTCTVDDTCSCAMSECPIICPPPMVCNPGTKMCQ